jgi:hypothetical protein
MVKIPPVAVGAGNSVQTHPPKKITGGGVEMSKVDTNPQ